MSYGALGTKHSKPNNLSVNIQMFKNEVQSSHLSIFSSTGSHPLWFWHTETDPGLPKDSHATLMDDAEDIDTSRNLDYIQLEENEAQSISLSHPVLHMQSPALSGTFIRCPSSMSESLGIVLPWLHFQVRNLGKPWAFEIGVSDTLGHQASIRCCTFQVRSFLNYTLAPWPMLQHPVNSKEPK